MRGAKVTYTEVRPLGEEFQRYLVKQTGNTRLMTMLEPMREQLRSVRTMSIPASRRGQGLVHEPPP